MVKKPTSKIKIDKEKERAFKEFEKLRRKWAIKGTSDVLFSLYKRIIEKGKASDIRLWFKIVVGWSEKRGWPK